MAEPASTSAAAAAAVGAAAAVAMAMPVDAAAAVVVAPSAVLDVSADPSGLLSYPQWDGIAMGLPKDFILYSYNRLKG